MQGITKLEQFAKRMKDEVSIGTKPQPELVKARDFLRWFGYERRSTYLVSLVRNTLEKLELRTIPDFQFVYIDSTITIDLEPAAGVSSSERLNDPTVRIGVLGAANQKPTIVKPSASLSTATTLMLLNDFSQLPVIDGKKYRDVKGIISWKSIGSRLALGHELKLANDCMDPAKEIDIEAPLLDAIGDISEHGYVLVRGRENEITGIVTASDVTRQFIELAGPFLVIAEIEGHLRSLVHGKFTVEQYKEASPNLEDGHIIAGSADLTLGGFCSLLQKPERWHQLKLIVDRTEFIRHLDTVREIRNDVMHFDPEGLEPKHSKKLQDLAKFFRDLVSMNAI